MRDAIIVSGWTWEAHNVPERLALALAHTGRRILYCEHPRSFFRGSARKLTEVDKEIFAFSPKFCSARLNSVSRLSGYQAKMVATQILANALKLKLRDPFFIYPHGDFSLALCREFKRRGFCPIYFCMDYEPPLSIEHAQQADLDSGNSCYSLPGAYTDIWQQSKGYASIRITSYLRLESTSGTAGTVYNTKAPVGVLRQVVRSGSYAVGQRYFG